jgi:hypothetical protein
VQIVTVFALPLFAIALAIKFNQPRVMFGSGLAVSGMTEPTKVILNVRSGEWDPSLLRLLGGATALWRCGSSPRRCSASTFSCRPTSRSMCAWCSAACCSGSAGQSVASETTSAAMFVDGSTRATSQTV